MSKKLLTLTCGGLGLLIGIVALPPLTAEDQAPPSASTTDAAAPGSPMAASTNPDTQGYVLSYKYQKGEVVRYETVQKVKFVSQFQGNAETATNETHTRKSYRVVKANPDGSAELELVIEWVKMVADFGGGGLPTEFDSSDPAARSQIKFRDVLRNVGRPQARLVVSPSGKVQKIEDLAAANPSGIGPQPIQLKDMASRDDFSFLTIFPEKPVKVGESWVEKSEIKVIVEDNLKKAIQAQRTYTLKAVENGMATIAFRTVILTPVKDNNIAIQLIQRETFGEIVFDMQKGAVLTRNVDHDKSVINPAGSNTAMHSKSHLLERLMTETAAISDIDSNATRK